MSEVSETMEDMVPPPMKPKDAVGQWWVKACIIILTLVIALTPVVLVLYSDSHNDARYVKAEDAEGVVIRAADKKYVPLTAYQDYKENTSRQLDDIKANQSANSQNLNQKLDSLSSDIREIRNALWIQQPATPRRTTP